MALTSAQTILGRLKRKVLSMQFSNIMEMFDVAGNERSLCQKSSGCNKGISQVCPVIPMKFSCNSDGLRCYSKPRYQFKKAINFYNFIFFKFSAGKKFIFSNNRNSGLCASFFNMLKKYSYVRISSQMINQNVSVNKIFHWLDPKKRCSSFRALPGRVFIRSPFGKVFTKDTCCILHYSFRRMFYGFSYIRLQEFPFNSLKFFFQIFDLFGEFEINHKLFPPYLRKS